MTQTFLPLASNANHMLLTIATACVVEALPPVFNRETPHLSTSTKSIRTTSSAFAAILRPSSVTFEAYLPLFAEHAVWAAHTIGLPENDKHVAAQGKDPASWPRESCRGQLISAIRLYHPPSVPRILAPQRHWHFPHLSSPPPDRWATSQTNAVVSCTRSEATMPSAHAYGTTSAQRCVSLQIGYLVYTERTHVQKQDRRELSQQARG